jgi:hypothetical protein
MVQSRVKGGKDFERHICKINGYRKHSKTPRLKWAGEGNNNIERILSLNKDPRKFRPILSDSKFVKSDARDKEGNLYEIKKYDRIDLKKYRLYSEPIIKIAPSRSNWGVGNPYYDHFSNSDEYNKFIRKMTKTWWWRKHNKTIMDNITGSNCGVICKDGMIPHSDLEFKWVINKGEYGPIFDDYYRLSIIFKIKDEKIPFYRRLLKFRIKNHIFKTKRSR